MEAEAEVVRERMTVQRAPAPTAAVMVEETPLHRPVCQIAVAAEVGLGMTTKR